MVAGLLKGFSFRPLRNAGPRSPFRRLDSGRAAAMAAPYEASSPQLPDPHRYLSAIRAQCFARRSRRGELAASGAGVASNRRIFASTESGSIVSEAAARDLHPSGPVTRATGPTWGKGGGESRRKLPAWPRGSPANKSRRIQRRRWVYALNDGRFEAGKNSLGSSIGVDLPSSPRTWYRRRLGPQISTN